jgi:hypothetical protein
MELNISCIIDELFNIVKDHHNYSTDVVLYSLGLIELVDIVNNINLLPIEFIKYLKKIKNSIKCYIDFDYLYYFYKNKKSVYIQNINLSSSSSFSSISNLDHEIENMIKDDTQLVNEIVDYENNLLKIDDYGKINKGLLKIVKLLFDLFDFNQDGYISALDTIKILEINGHYPLLLDCNFERKIVKLLAKENNKVNFLIFYDHLIGF